jgi:enoyl-CoA hydratase
MLSARMVSATEAHVMGLVNYIVEEQNELLAKTRELLSIINDKAPVAVARIIECANIAAGESLADDGGAVRNGFLREQEAFGECFGTEDMKEGAKAFLEKRKAVFTGK